MGSSTASSFYIFLFFDTMFSVIHPLACVADDPMEAYDSESDQEETLYNVHTCNRFVT